jgi:hypothetical protein
MWALGSKQHIQTHQQEQIFYLRVLVEVHLWALPKIGIVWIQRIILIG